MASTSQILESSNDLLKRADRSLDFAEAAISLVQTDDPGIDLRACEAPPDKIIAETAMLLRAVSAIPPAIGGGVTLRAKDLIQRLLPYARHRRIEVSIALFPALTLDYAAAHLVLSQAGYPNEDFDGTVAIALKSSVATARERLPHRELEQMWLASFLGQRQQSKDILSRTNLLQGVDAITGSRDDIYAFTHSLMYATDFGNISPASDWPVDKMLSLAESLLIAVLDDDDFDIAGELLLTWPFLGIGLNKSATLAFAMLSHIEDEVGVLPSLALDRNEYERQSGASKKHYVVATSYHTAYVMGLLCSTLLRCKQAQQTQTGDQADDQVDVDRETVSRAILDELVSTPTLPQWLRYFCKLPEKSHSVHVSFLLQAALRRAVRRTDFAQARDLLRSAYEMNLSSSAICLQAAEMMNRLASLT